MFLKKNDPQQYLMACNSYTFLSISEAGSVALTCILHPPGAAKITLGIDTEGPVTERKNSMQEDEPMCQESLVRYYCI